MDLVRDGAIRAGCVTRKRCIVAGSSFVDQVLNDSRVGHGKSTEKEAHGDACNGPEWDADLS